MAVVRSAIMVSAVLAAPTMFMKQPLSTGTGGQVSSYAVQRLSPMAMAGRGLYNRHCAGCHGVNADGTGKGPGLLKNALATGKRARMGFHLAIRDGRPANDRGWPPMPAFDLSFNRIEMIGRFLRELAEPGR